MKVDFGKIGSREIDLAISELKENKYIRNIWVHTTHNNEVSGKEYDKLIDLIDDDLCIYDNEASYKEDCETSYIEPDDDILELLKNGTVYHDCENDRFSNDLKDIIEFMITDGSSYFYSYDEALENLQSDYVNEALVIFLLQ